MEIGRKGQPFRARRVEVSLEERQRELWYSKKNPSIRFRGSSRNKAHTRSLTFSSRFLPACPGKSWSTGRWQMADPEPWPTVRLAFWGANGRYQWDESQPLAGSKMENQRPTDGHSVGLIQKPGIRTRRWPEVCKIDFSQRRLPLLFLQENFTFVWGHYITSASEQEQIFWFISSQRADREEATNLHIASPSMNPAVDDLMMGLTPSNKPKPV